MLPIRHLTFLFLMLATGVSTVVRAENSFPSGCLCKDAFKKVTLEVTDPNPPYKKHKVHELKQVKGLLHCNCGKQECVIAVPAEKELIEMSCTDR